MTTMGPPDIINSFREQQQRFHHQPLHVLPPDIDLENGSLIGVEEVRPIKEYVIACQHV